MSSGRLENAPARSHEEEIRVGSIVTFGRYYNASGSEQEPLKWRVLDIDGNSALLLAENCIDARSFHHESANDMSWERSDIRKWLNNGFIHMAFSGSEQKKLLAGGNSSNLGAGSGDKVFLLSIDEAGKYFRNNETRRCKVTAYARSMGASVYPENTMFVSGGCDLAATTMTTAQHMCSMMEALSATVTILSTAAAPSVLLYGSISNPETAICHDV